MLLAIISLLTGLIISAVAIYYSVVGLTAIFAAAAIPIMVMGVALEVAKLVATVWLKQNWAIAPRLIKLYLTTSVIILMFITSMGIFGFLSKAHLDQGMVSGDVLDKVAIIDSKIQTQKDNMDAARKALKQMDESVDQVMSRSNDEKGADKAVQLRRSQAKERSRLQTEISTAQAEVSKLQGERAPIATELRKVEAEVGPIKYIASFVYGTAEQNVLEKAVTWLIIIIVVVFDPLAVILLLASQYSFAQVGNKTANPGQRSEIDRDDNKVAEPVVDKISQKIFNIRQWFSDSAQKIKGAIRNPVKELALDSKEVEDPVNDKVVALEDIEPAQYEWKDGFIAQEVADVLPEAVTQVPSPEEQKYMLDAFVEAVKASENLVPVPAPIQGFEVPRVNETHEADIQSLALNAPALPKEELPIDDLDAWNKMIEAAEAEVARNPHLSDISVGEEHEFLTEDGLKEFQFNGDKWIPKEETTSKYQLLPELKEHIENRSYVQNEEQTESNLWQETRKLVEEETKEHISQEDYQVKVKEAIVKRLVKNIEEGRITIEEMTDDEAEAVQQYLQKEINDR